MRYLVERAHEWDVSHRTHNLDHPIEARELGVRETTVRKRTAKFQGMVCDLNTCPKTLLPLAVVSTH